MRARRLAAVAALALAFTPGLLWRDDPRARDGPQPLLIRPLPLPAKDVPLAPGLALVGGWELDSRSEGFGGYSSLLPLPDGELLALSDRGRYLRFGPPGSGRSAMAMGTVGGANDSDKRLYDIESATRDPRSGTIWLGYEGRNAIRRFDGGLHPRGQARPAAMRGWPSNRGPEALARLRDGRFLVLSEAVGGDPPASIGLLFAADPVDRIEPLRFHFVPPDDFRPTDIAQLPDGRMLVLLRRLELAPFPRLTSRLVVADPAAIEPGEAWRWRPLGAIRAPLPAENYEGLAIVPRTDGTARVWLISDDNSATFQRTLLLALEWTPGATKKARRIAAGPSKRSQ